MELRSKVIKFLITAVIAEIDVATGDVVNEHQTKPITHYPAGLIDLKKVQKQVEEQADAIFNKKT